MSHSRSAYPQRHLLIITSVILIVSYLVAAYNPYYQVDLDDLEELQPALENSYGVQDYPTVDKRQGFLQIEKKAFSKQNRNKAMIRNQYN